MKKLLKVMVLALILLIYAHPSYAHVVTGDKAGDYGEYISVAGNHDNHPIEYYNTKTKSFEGVMPDVLGVISQKTGIDFVYINGSNGNAQELYISGEAQLVSCFNPQAEELVFGDFVPMFSYSSNGEASTYGIAFSNSISPSSASQIKASASEISHETIDGFVVAYAGEGHRGENLTVLTLCCCIILFAIVISLCIRHIINTKHKNKARLLIDSETGIGNLAYFKKHFEDVTRDNYMEKYHIAYIVLDSSYLRSYHGASTFSEVLSYTAHTLSEETDKSEFVARITENGFAMMYLSENDAVSEKRISRLLKKLNEYVDANEKNNKLVFHSAIYRLSSSDQKLEILLFNLRKNCNKIFGSDKEYVVCDKHSMNLVQEEKKITENIIHAFENDEFKLYLQFIIDAKTGKISSAEALSRWHSKANGILPPFKYIGIMEEDGLISTLDYYMFNLVCATLEKWRGTKYEEVGISCNFTRITLSEKGFIQKIKEICNKYDFDKSKICIEITEDAIEKNMDNALSNIALCKEMGFKIALDDLGSGYTSFSNLCEYPIDVVKIDRDILLKTDTPRGKALFEGIVELSHKLNLKVVCEGVETEEQNNLANNTKCDYIQGFYYYKPEIIDQTE